MIQILHRVDFKSGHWFTIWTVDCKEGTINWYDSIYNDLDKESKQQICAIMNDGKNLIFQKCPKSDRGFRLWTIRYNNSFCYFNLFWHEPLKLYLRPRKKRRHLIKCLKNQKFSNFPFSINTNWKKEDGNKNEREYILYLSRSL